MSAKPLVFKTPGDTPRALSTQVKVENNSDCLLVAVTIMRTTETDGKVVHELYWARWLTAGDTDVVYLMEGEYYTYLVESYYFSEEDPYKATAPFTTEFGHGRYDSTKPHSRKIDIRCQHTQLRDA